MRRVPSLFHNEHVKSLPPAVPRRSYVVASISERRDHPYRLANFEITRIFIDFPVRRDVPATRNRPRSEEKLIPARYA